MSYLGDHTSHEWWLAVQAIAGLVSDGDIAPSEQQILSHELDRQGFSSGSIEKALGWVHNVSLTSNVFDILDMLQHTSPQPRMSHPIETAGLPPEFMRGMERLRLSGVLTTDVAERLVEGVRTLDTEEWDQQDVDAFFAEVLENYIPGCPPAAIRDYLDGRTPQSLH